MAEVPVNLGAASYSIHIEPGSFQKAGEWLRPMNFSPQILVITDDHVGPLYGDLLINILQQAGFAPILVSVVPGEGAKSLAVAESLYTKAIELGLDRRSPIIALGGGVVGDLAGFVAATYLRGVPLVQIPTTLLAQVDSSIGGKVGINHPLGKNLIGAFYQPKLVIIDPELLQTLPARELHTGLAEVIKYGVIADAEFFAYLKEHCGAILAQNPAALQHIIKRSCQVKAEVVAEDERESGLRVILNFGHTIGHAIEGATSFRLYNHGEAVAIGMYGAALVSQHLGLCEASDVASVANRLLQFQLPIKAKEVSPEDLLPYLSRDKKSIGGKINWVLVDKIGQVTVRSDVPIAVVEQVLQELT